MIKTFGTLFSGFGGAESGLKAAGLTPVVAIEVDPRLAEVYRANHGDHVTVADVCDVDFMKLERPDWLHASPVCKEFSVAKAKGEESSLDFDTAKATCRAIECWVPEIVTIENVWGYRNSKSFALICAELTRLGYWFETTHENSANYGVPQTRKRLILRASRDGWLPPLPTKTAWRGWYEAIEDLIPTLPESEFAKWQLDRLPKEQMLHTITSLDPDLRAFLVPGGNASSFVLRYHKQPSPTVGDTERVGNIPRAFIMDGKPKNYAGELQITDGDPFRAWLNEGRTVKMIPRCLARFQSFPDSFELPKKDSLAVMGIGNAVPCLMMQRIAEGMVAA